MMSHTLEQQAALLALVLHRPSGLSTREIMADVLASEDAVLTWETLHGVDLFGQSDELVAARREIERWTSKGHRFVSVLENDYPERLRSVYDAPPFIFYRGQLACAAGGVSVVGSRDASRQACERASSIARLLVDRGIPVISGLARGIDAAAHEAAIEAGGRAVGVIATGIEGPYTPASSRSLHEEVARLGVLISQFMPSSPAQKHTFLMRNATMSGLGLATIVVEAGEHSGARAQARLAMQHGRPVILTESVIGGTQWGKELADGNRPNVYPVSGLADVSDALDRIIWTTSDDLLDRVLTSV